MNTRPGLVLQLQEERKKTRELETKLDVVKMDRDQYRVQLSRLLNGMIRSEPGRSRVCYAGFTFSEDLTLHPNPEAVKEAIELEIKFLRLAIFRQLRL
jgi:hypothetical protein